MTTTKNIKITKYIKSETNKMKLKTDKKIKNSQKYKIKTAKNIKQTK